MLDLGCGPGLYASRLAKNGMKVTGVDISKSSIDYATKSAKEKKLKIDYRHINFLDVDYRDEFDAAIQIYGEINTLSDINRDRLLAKIHRALKPEGLLIFDVSTREQFKRNVKKSGLKNGWQINDGGFWRPGKHLILEQDFDYPENNIYLSQTIIIDENQKVSVYRLWYHDYTLESITPVLKKTGFEIVIAWNDFTGTPHKEGGDWIAIVAGKR